MQVIEQLAIEAEATAANISGELDRVDNEMFVISSTVPNSSDRRTECKSDAQIAKPKLVPG